MRPHRFPKNELGFTLIESGLALLVAMLVIASAVWAFNTIKQKAEVKAAVEGINFMYQASQDWAMSRPNFSGVNCSVLVAQNLLPQGMGDCTGSNPWGGSYSVGAAANQAQLVVTLTDVPAGPGAQLVDKLRAVASITPTYASNTFSVTF